MATLLEYFQKDFASTCSAGQNLTIKDERTGEHVLEAQARLHFAIEANALFISYYIPSSSKLGCPSRIILNSVGDVLKLADSVQISVGFSKEVYSRSHEAIFTGRIYIYSEDNMSLSDREAIASDSLKLGHSVVIRTQEYAKDRALWESPLAFISHDSRDKKELAEPLAIALQKLLCPVWYDEYSLKVGDSLREGIEKGLRECKKCVFLITPNFLANGGWAKREYDSIFTRELVEDQKVILPVWYNITKQDVYQYSPILADRVALIWNGNADDLALKLYHAIV